MSKVEIAVGNTTYSSARTGELDSFTAVTSATQPTSTNWSKTFVVGSANSSEANYLED